MAFRSASTAIVTPSSSATMPIGPSPSARLHPPHLPRRPFADGAPPAPATTRPTPPRGHPLGAEPKTQAAPHLQPLPPPSSASRYLSDGGDRISLQLVRHLRVATT